MAKMKITISGKLFRKRTAIRNFLTALSRYSNVLILCSRLKLINFSFRKQRKASQHNFLQTKLRKTLGRTIFFDGNSKAQSMVGQEIGKTERKLLMVLMKFIWSRDATPFTKQVSNLL